ncbi:type I-E CRISPR-associated protein Cse1/CasA [Phenylobacterium sp.]|uniref:type I-E CRISPR-associated protein Cse1/CasA n=1 Tax=Phenylobacterium sp. TaxID=1871053 RepID=UPI00301C4CBB
MSFNLVASKWLPVRRASGARQIIAPAEVADGFADDPILALDFSRPDWNGAVTEWLIGLTFLAMPPRDVYAWADLFETPLGVDDLDRALSPLVPWFGLDGEGPRAFQDLDPLADQDVKAPDGLLIDAPGENTLKNNADLFVKRGANPSLGLAEAAAALITLQTYAPSGGAGHRTSMRGGGPLTTLVAPVRPGPLRTSTLWDRIWANVPPDGDVGEARDALPWLRPTLTSGKSDLPVTPEGRHPALVFFACPRRIRLVFEDQRGERRVVGYRTQNYGANYLGWEHPLSPYREDPKSGKLPIHPRSGASNYGDWTAWWGFGGAPAAVTVAWAARSRELSDDLRMEMHAFGYDMDNMKARQWVEARLPWVDVSAPALEAAVTKAVEAADAAAKALRRAAKLAIYGQRRGEVYNLPEGLPLDSLPESYDRLWRETQGAFERLLRDLEARLHASGAETSDLLLGWAGVLRAACGRIFAETVDVDALGDAEPRRLLMAQWQLWRDLASLETKTMKIAPLDRRRA